ncbi:MAG: hypothetical protein AAGI68_15960 [Planctomycetota bacterium]
MPSPAATFDASFDWFIDREVVLSRTTRAERRVMIRVGGRIRTWARRSIRPRSTRRRPEQISQPGDPPFSKTGFLKQLIFFSYDPQESRVVIGPAKSNSAKADRGIGPTVPELLEHGGRITVKRTRKPKRAGEGNRRRSRYRSYQVTLDYPERPYMRPALAENLDFALEAWKGVVR